MPTVRISTLMPETKKLLQIADDGSVWVQIQPPDFLAERERAQLKEQVTHSVDSFTGAPTFMQNFNSADLSMLEIWLSYKDSNIDVEITIGHDEDGEPSSFEHLKFGPREKESRAAFLEKLGKLPPVIVNEWHTRVLQVIPSWNPFAIGTPPVREAS